MSFVRPFERLGPSPFVLEGDLSFEDRRGELRPEVHLLQPFVAENCGPGTPRTYWYYYGLTFGHGDVHLILVIGSIVQASYSVELHGLVRRQDTFSHINSELAARVLHKSSERRGDAARIRQY